MPKQYPEEFKLQLVHLSRSGMSPFALSQRFHIAQSTLYRWLREYGADAEGHTLTDYKALNKENTRLVHILQIIRLSGIINNASRSKRLEILANLHAKFDHYSVSELCEALDIAKGTFYNHIFRKADRTKYLEEQQELRLQVQRVFDDSKQRYGAEKIRVTLAESGINVSTKRIRAVMQKLGLVSIRENAKTGLQKAAGISQTERPKSKLQSQKYERGVGQRHYIF